MHEALVVSVFTAAVICEEHCKYLHVLLSKLFGHYRIVLAHFNLYTWRNMGCKTGPRFTLKSEHLLAPLLSLSFQALLFSPTA